MRRIIRRAVAASFLAVLCAGCGAQRPPATARNDDAVSHYKKAIQSREQRRYADCIKELEQAIRLDPQNPTYRYELATVHFTQGDWDAAVASLLEVKRMDPDNLDARNLLGSVLFEKGQREAALEEFRGILEKHNYPTPEKVWVNIGKAYDQMGNSEEAINSYRKALDANPRYGRAHYGLAQVLDKLDRLSEAVAEYDVAAPDYEGSSEFHYRLGFACFRAGMTERAKEQLGLVVEKSPGTSDAARAEELLKLIR